MNLLRLLVFVVLFVACFCDDWSAPCNRTRCTCKWMNGKKSALCNGAEHTHVPVTLSTDLQVLSLNENNIGYLNREEFYQNGLEHLQRIFVKGSRVQHVHREAFKNLKILVEIDLSENAIETLEPGTFSGNDRLRVLYLYGNPLTQLAVDQFPALPHLRTLDLHDCQLQSVSERAFLRVDQLEYLSLQNNSLATLPANVFAHMHLLKTLVLGDNPWHCDCHLRPFRNWYVRTNYPKLVCILPTRHSHSEWDQVSADQMGCLPAVLLTADHNVQGEVFGPTNASFHCLVSGDPLPQIAWELNGSPLSEGYNVVLITGLEEDVLWSNLTILNVTTYDSGTYGCRAWNVVGEVDQNATLFLPEVVEHVIVKTHETFWYFGLIVGTFGTVFGLLLVSVTVCYCRKAAMQRSARRRHQQKKRQQLMAQGTTSDDGRLMKGSVTFTEREKRLLDLSLTNDRVDSCELVTPSTTITLNNSISVGYTHRHPVEEQQQHQLQSQPPLGPMQVTVEREIQQEQFPPPPAEFSCTANGTSVVGQPHSSANIHLYAGAQGEESGHQHPANQYLTETAPGYGNIYISVSVAKDAMDHPDLNMYPDLLNIPNRIKMGECSAETVGVLNSQNSDQSIAESDPHNQLSMGVGEGSVAFYTDIQPPPNALVSYSTVQQMPQERILCVDGTGQVIGLQQLQPQTPCLYATLPRQPRHAQFFSSIGTRSGSPCNSSSSGASSCSGLVTPILINGSTNKAAVGNTIQFRDHPQMIPENGDGVECVLPYHSATEAATLNRRTFRGTGKSFNQSPQSLSPRATVSGGGSGSGGEGTNCPSKYDNIGRRITASGNSAIKVPGTEDDDSVGDGGSLPGVETIAGTPPLAAPPAWQDNVDGNSADISERRSNSDLSSDENRRWTRSGALSLVAENDSVCGGAVLETNNRTYSGHRGSSLDNVPL